MSMRHDDDAHGYAHHHHHAHHHHSHSHSPHQHAHGAPLGLGLPGAADARYASMSLEDIRFPPDDAHAGEYAGARARYAGSAPASWHPGLAAAASARAGLPAQYLAPQPQHAPPHAQLGLSLHIPPPAAHTPAMDRLPADSTLLTPLPGYEPPPLLPPLNVGADAGYYEGGMYEEEGGARPGTGHASLGGSGEEYEL